MTQRETLITAIVVLCEHGKQAPDEVEQIMREVKDCKYDEKVGEQRAM